MKKSLKERLAILSDAAKYDASCASSGTSKRDSLGSGGLGSTEGSGICHAYAPDGRCISLLKILLTNFCIYDCAYCINRSSSNVERARFTPEEVIWLTLEFYRRNYIEGLFLSSGIIRSSDHTMEEMAEPTLQTKRRKKFAPAGQSTQMIVGADGANDATILGTSARLYGSYGLKRVYYSAFSPIPDSSKNLPLIKPPLMREHRLYQADWLYRFYCFDIGEITSTRADGMLDLDLDPKLAWALAHREQFPVDVNRADKEKLLRVPGLGTKTVKSILSARRFRRLRLDDLKRLGVSLRKIQPFVTAEGWTPHRLVDRPDLRAMFEPKPEQLSLL